MAEIDETLDLTTDDFSFTTDDIQPAGVAKPAKRKPSRPTLAPAAQPIVPQQEPLPSPLTARALTPSERAEQIMRPKLRDFMTPLRDVTGKIRPERVVSPELSRRVQLQREREAEPLYKKAGRRLYAGAAQAGTGILRAAELLTEPIDPTRPAPFLEELTRTREGAERALAEEEMIDPTTGAKVTRGIVEAGIGLIPAIGAARTIGPILGPTLYTGATADWERDPTGAALRTATAFLPIKVGQAASPLAARTAMQLSARPVFQKAAQFGIEAGAGAAANVGQYAATQGLLGRRIDPGELAAQAVTGGVLSGYFTPPLGVAAGMPLPRLPKLPAMEFSFGALPGKQTRLRLTPGESNLFAGIPIPLADATKDPVHWYYSALERAVEQKFPNKMQPDQAAAMLTSSKYGIKAEELEWSGLDELLAQKAVRGEPITKQEILGTIRDNRVRVEEVVKGGIPGERMELRRSSTNPEANTYIDNVSGQVIVLPEWREGGASVMAQYERLATPDEAEIIRQGGTPRTQEIAELGVKIDQNRQMLEEIAQEMRDYHNREQAGYRLTPEEDQELADFSHEAYGLERENTEMQARLTELNKTVGGGTRFEGFRALRGGKPGSYRELLLTMPDVEAQRLERANKARRDEIDRRIGELREEGGRRSGQYDPSRFPPEIQAEYYALNEEAADLRQTFGESRKGQFVYENHFSEPNILVHVRFDEGKDAEGRRVLRIQEIQSDWHQQGREKGYQTEERRRQYLTPEELADPTFNVTGVPDAPFKSTWHELAFKRMIRWAADNGYQRLVWTKGRSQIDLYEEEGRRINVDRIQLRPSRLGKYMQADKTAEAYDLYGYRGDKEVSESTMVDRAWLEKRLGKQQTEELLNQLEVNKQKQAETDEAYNWQTAPVEALSDPEPERGMQGRFKVTMPDGSKATFIGWSEMSARAQARAAYQDDARPRAVVGEITGQDISIGGRVHRALYDEKLPQLAREYAKKTGGQYGRVGVETTPQYRPSSQWRVVEVQRTDGTTEYIVRDRAGISEEEYGPFSRREDAVIAADNAALGEDPRPPANIEEAHYLDISTKLAEQARYEGFKQYSNPLFDPEAYRRFLGGLFRRSRRPAEQPLTEEQQARLDPNDPNYEVESQRSQNQQAVQDTIDQVMSGVSKAGGQEYYTQVNQEFAQSKLARTQARNRLRKLEALRENPEFLDPVRKADLDEAIRIAKVDREATLKSSQEARKRAGIAQGLVQQEQRKIAAAAAQTRLKTPVESYPVDAGRPMYVEEFLGFNLTKPFYDAAQDAMVAAGYELDPNRTVTSQVVELAAAGRIPLEQFDQILERNGLSMTDFLNQVTATASEAGRMLAKPSHIARQLNKLAKTNPALAKALNERLPTITELNKQWRERSNLDRFLSIRSGLLISLLETAQRNLDSAGLVTGLDSLGQLFDSAIQHTFGAKRFDNKAALSPAVAIRPTLNLITELARTAANGLNYKENSGAISRVVNAMSEAFPQEVKHPLFEILNSDLEEMPVGGRISAGRATPEMLAKWRADAEAMPDSYARKPKLLAAIAAAEKRQANTARLLTAGLIRGEKVVHALNWFNRAQETITRRAIFEAKLRRYTQEAGVDLDGLIAEGQAASVPVELVTRAANEALRITFGKRPERGTATDYLRRGLATGPVGAIVKLGFHPFPTFLGNFIKFTYEHSPLGLIGAMRPKELAKMDRGDFGQIWKALVGTAVYAMASQMREDFYNQAGTPLGPTEAGEFEKNLRAPFKATGAYPQAGEKWYQVKLLGRNVDMRFTPFAPAFFAADLQARNRRGLGTLGVRDAMEAMGGSLRGLDQQAEIVTEAINGIKDAEKTVDAGKASGKWLGAIAAGFLTPLRYISDAAAVWYPEERTRKDVGQGEGFGGAFGAQIQERIPGWRQYLPEAEVPTREAAPQPRYGPVPSGYERFGPAARQITGLPVEEPKTFLESKLDTLGIKPFEIVPRTGNPRADRVINREMGKFMDGLSDYLSKDHRFNAASPEQQRAVLMDEIFPAYWGAVKDSAFAEVPEELVKAEILKIFSKEQRNAEDRRARREGKPTLLEEEIRKQRGRAIAQPSRPTLTPSPTPFR